MAIRECPEGHVVTDDSLGFCPECKKEGATVPVGSPTAARQSSSPHTGTDASSTAGLLLIFGILLCGIGSFLVAGADGGGTENLGRFFVLAGGIPIWIAITAYAVSLGVRMSRER